jgi:hypothetical protein
VHPFRKSGRIVDDVAVMYVNKVSSTRNSFTTYKKNAYLIIAIATVRIWAIAEALNDARICWGAFKPARASGKLGGVRQVEALMMQAFGNLLHPLYRFRRYREVPGHYADLP